MPRSNRPACPQWIKRLARSYANDRNGATAVEFAMVSVPFLGLLFAIFQTSYMFLAQQAVDAAATAAGRNIMTGQTMSSATMTTATAFRNAVICPNLPSFLTCANLIIDVRTAGSSGSTSWSSATTANNILNASTSFCIGSPGDVVVARIIYPVPAFLSIMTLNQTLSNAGAIAVNTAGQSLQTSSSKMVYPIMGVAAFKNEPFTAGAGGPGC